MMKGIDRMSSFRLFPNFKLTSAGYSLLAKSLLMRHGAVSGQVGQKCEYTPLT